MRQAIVRITGFALFFLATRGIAAEPGSGSASELRRLESAIRLRLAIEELGSQSDAPPPFHPLYVPREQIDRSAPSTSATGPGPVREHLPPPENEMESDWMLRDTWARSPSVQELRARIEAALAAPDERASSSGPGSAAGPIDAAALFPNATEGIGPNSWTTLVPALDYESGIVYAGRISSIARAFDPVQGIVTSFAGTTGGGLYKVWVFPPFAFWVSVSSALPGSPAVGSFIVRPSDGNQILIGSGEFYRYGGDGIYKSTNAGATWTRKATPTSFPATFRLRSSWANDAVVMAATEGSLLRSTNFGETWTTVMSGVTATDVIQDPVTPQDWYVAISGTGVLESFDGGQSFHPFGPGCAGLPGPIHRTELAIPASAPNYVYALVANDAVLNNIYRSSDYGCHWTGMELGPDQISWGQAFQSMAIVADPATPARVFVAMGAAQWTANATAANPADICWVRGEPGPSDCGIPYTISPNHPDIPDLLLTGNHLWIANDGGLFDHDLSDHTTTDLGNALGLTALQTYSEHSDLAASLSDPEFLLAGLQDNAIARITGSVAQRIGGGDGGLTSISPDNTTNLFWTYGPGPLTNRQISTDGGDTSSGLNCSLGESGYSLLIDPTPGLQPGVSLLFTVGKDAGNNTFLWSKEPDTTCDWQKVHPVALPSTMDSVDQANDPARWTLYVSGSRNDGRLFVLDTGSPGSMTYVERTPPFAVAGGSSVVAADHSGVFPGRVYYATSYSRPSRAWLSNNRAQTWKEVTGNLDVISGSANFFEMTGDPGNPKTLFIGSDVGIFRTDSADLAYPIWYRYMEGLPAVVRVQNLEVSLLAPGGPHALRIGTYGKGLWERTVAPTSFLFADGFGAGSLVAWSSHLP